MLRRAVAGDEAALKLSMGKGEVVPLPRPLDPVALPAGRDGDGVILEQQDRVAAERLQREQSAILVPADAAIDPGHDPDALAPAPLDGAVAAAIRRDDEFERCLGQGPQGLDQLAQAGQSAIGVDHDAEADRIG